jgi:hypothetical protein
MAIMKGRFGVLYGEGTKRSVEARPCGSLQAAHADVRSL